VAIATAAHRAYATVVVRASNAKSCRVKPEAVREVLEKLRDAR